MWMDLYDAIRTPVIYFGIGLFVLALVLIIKDFIQDKERRSCTVAIILLIALIALAASMI
ncbi:MAG: hypothetical protein Q8933_09420 [Bacteroidota bacterium]|nr:hypothetical protein [Bacteroidota bacterium]